MFSEVTDKDFAAFWEAHGSRMWRTTSKLRSDLYHQSAACAAGLNPQILGGTGACHQCEAQILDLAWAEISKTASVAC